jgi:hypothetical protein
MYVCTCTLKTPVRNKKCLKPRNLPGPGLPLAPRDPAKKYAVRLLFGSENSKILSKFFRLQAGGCRIGIFHAYPERLSPTPAGLGTMKQKRCTSPLLRHTHTLLVPQDTFREFVRKLLWTHFVYIRDFAHRSSKGICVATKACLAFHQPPLQPTVVNCHLPGH